MNIENMTRHYLICALWSSVGDDGRLLDDTLTLEDFAPEAIEQAKADCAAFVEAAGNLLNEWTDEQAGHDLWLDRNGHGAGFWDRQKDAGEALSNLCGWRTKFPEVDCYVGDDGFVYFS